MLKYSVATALLGVCLLLGNQAMAQDAMPANPPTSESYPTAQPHPGLKPVFEEFGGKPGLTALMDDFMDNLMADPRTHPFFAPVDRDHIKKELVLQFCVILGGPCTYTGHSMTEVHKGMGVNRADFNALVEDLQKAMNTRHIPFRAQNKLLAILAPMSRDIITQK
jgi:hemoglobin